jgi:hypothetical protein
MTTTNDTLLSFGIGTGLGAVIHLLVFSLFIGGPFFMPLLIGSSLVSGLFSVACSPYFNNRNRQVDTARKPRSGHELRLYD